MRKIADSDTLGNDDAMQRRRALLRAQARTHALASPQEDLSPGVLKPLNPEALKTSRPVAPAAPVDSDGRDLIAGATCEAVDGMERIPARQYGFHIARTLKAYGFPCSPAIAMLAAETALAHAESLGLPVAEDLDAESLAIDIVAAWDKVKFAGRDLILEAVQAAREAPGTLHVEGAGPRMRLVVGALWWLGHLSGQGIAHPSQQKLGEAIGWREHPQRRASSCLSALELLGVIECVKPHVPGVRGKTWRVNVGPLYTPPEGA